LLQIEGYVAHRTVVAVYRYPINRSAHGIENDPAAQIIVDAANVIVCLATRLRLLTTLPV